jgi:glycerate-2-kinase
LKEYRLWDQVPESVRAVLKQPKMPVARTSHPKNHIIGSNRLVIHTAQEKAVELGFPTRIITTRLDGEARIAGRRLAASLIGASEPQCLIAGGETTVDVRGGGIGGRNQELALAAALALEALPGCVLMSLATDGVDGPTPAAGAIVTGETIPRARQLGIDPEGALDRNDSFSFHQALDTAITTGPSGTNLNDLVVGVKYAVS